MLGMMALYPLTQSVRKLIIKVGFYIKFTADVRFEILIGIFKIRNLVLRSLIHFIKIHLFDLVHYSLWLFPGNFAPLSRDRVSKCLLSSEAQEMYNDTRLIWPRSWHRYFRIFLYSYSLNGKIMVDALLWWRHHNSKF